MQNSDHQFATLQLSMDSKRLIVFNLKPADMEAEADVTGSENDQDQDSDDMDIK